MSDFKAREWDWIVNIDCPLPEGIKNWPANIQDKIYSDLEARSVALGEKLYIAKSRVGFAPETGPFVHLRICNIPPDADIQKTGLQ